MPAVPARLQTSPLAVRRRNNRRALLGILMLVGIGMVSRHGLVVEFSAQQQQPDAVAAMAGEARRQITAGLRIASDLTGEAVAWTGDLLTLDLRDRLLLRLELKPWR